MNKKAILIAFLALAILISGCVQPPEPQPPKPSQEEIPYYFIAIHNEPLHDIPNSGQKLATRHNIMRQMVEKANQYNMKLTIMLSAQVADYIAADQTTLDEVKEWEAQGHELSSHHHAIYHSNWDGYTNYTEEEAIAQRIKQGIEPETYLGTLSDFVDRLQALNPEVKSGCVNEARDTQVMPDEIVYSTCSGYLNYGEPGRYQAGGDQLPEKGVNDFVSVATVNGIERKWLTHYQIYQGAEAGEEEFSSMDSGVYGVVVHNSDNEGQDQDLFEFMDFLHEKDPTGQKSKTVTEIIEEHLIPEIRINVE